MAKKTMKHDLDSVYELHIKFIQLYLVNFKLKKN